MFGLLESGSQSVCTTPSLLEPAATVETGESFPGLTEVSADSSDSLHRHLLGIGEFLPVLAPVRGLQGEGVCIDVREGVGGRRLLPILEDGGCLDDPLLAVPCPGAFAKAAGRVENPRPDTLGRRGPADPVRGTAQRDVLEGGRER